MNHLQVPNENSNELHSSGVIESRLASGNAEKITKSTTKNLKEVIQEAENESKESEDEKEKEQEVKDKIEKEKNTESPEKINSGRSESQDRFIKDESPQQSSSQEDFFSDGGPSPRKRRERIWEYMKNSSLFVLHKDNIFREYLLGLMTTPEDVVNVDKVRSNPEKYGIKDLKKSQSLKT